jgi:poly-gamma-glutamate capsule biosynthesis protein CapA/YwtB (metallophosphatase superfamily)
MSRGGPEAPPAATSSRPEPLVVAFVGDIAFAGNLEKHPDPRVFSGVADLLARAQIAVGNLECPLTRRGTHAKNKQCLRGDGAWAGVMREAGFTVLSLANNHLMDFGPEGLLDTLSALEGAGIACCGGGENIESARAPVYVRRGGRTVAFLSRSDVVVKSPCYAGPGTPGVARFDLEDTLSRAARCRECADHVVLLIHWGLEEYASPTPEQRKTAACLAAAGIDVIAGTHPHVLQGHELRGRTPVLYSVGNFVFDDYDWEFTTAEGVTTRIEAPLRAEKRRSAISYLDLSLPPAHPSVVCTAIGDGGRVERDTRLRRVLDCRLRSLLLRMPAYGLFWRFYSLVMEVRIRLLRSVLARFSLRKALMIRPRHIRELCSLMARSVRIVSGKSSDPYE